MRFLRAEALWHVNCLVCIPRPRLAWPKPDQGILPGMGFTLPARHNPPGWLRLFSPSLRAYLPSLAPADSRASSEKGKDPRPRPHQFPAI